MDGQHYWDTMATQQMMAGMSDDPGQFRWDDPMRALFDQAERARSGQEIGNMPYLDVPF